MAKKAPQRIEVAWHGSGYFGRINMAKKTKTKRRVIVPTWITRDSDGTYRKIVSCREPDIDESGEWGAGCNTGDFLGARDYEAGTPKSLHLKPGGGPLKVKLVKA